MQYSYSAVALIDKPTLKPNQNQHQRRINIPSNGSTSAPTASEAHHRALPPGVQRIGRAIALTDAGITPSRDEYHAIAAVGTSTHKIKFAPADEGKEGWLITWYVNTRGEMGPESVGLAFRVV